MSGWKYNNSGDVVTPVEVYGSNIMQPVDIQSHLQTTIQTHNAVSVPATTGLGIGVWIDTNGYDQVAVTFMNDAATASQVNIEWSNDAATRHGIDILIASGTLKERSGLTGTRARFTRVVLLNTDAAAHVMSAWIYLKA